mgnify:FL=1
MNESIQNMIMRRSVRKFKPDAVSGMGKQSSAVIVITNKDLRNRISEMNRKIGGWNEGFDPFYGVEQNTHPCSNLLFLSRWRQIL